MNWKTKFNILNLGFVSALSILVVLSMLSYSLFNKHIANRNSIVHTHIVLHASKDLIAAMTDAETGQRGFLLTGNEQFLEPFYISTERSSKLMEELRFLTGDNKSQQERCTKIEQLVAQKYRFIRESIDLKRAGKFNKVLEMVNSGEGKAIMDSLRTIFKSFDAEERTLLAIRENKTKQAEYTTKPILITGTIVSLGMFIFIYLSLLKQIRARIRNEGELRDSREWFSKTLASIGDGVIATDEHFIVSFMNPVAEQLTGWTQSEAKGKPVDIIFNVVNEFSRSRVENPLVTAMLEKRIISLAENTVLVRKDKSEISIDDSGSPIMGRSGNVKGGILIFRDITEAKRAEKELKMFFQITIDIAGVAANGYFRRINPSVEKILGYTEDEFLSHPFIELIHPDDVEKTQAVVGQLLEGKSAVNFINRYRAKNGDYKWLEWSVSAQAGNFYALGRDISERRQAEETMHGLHRDLQHKNSEIVDSINYAKRIQNAFLPSNSLLLESFPDSFILNKPKDIVSGDFYWICRKGGKIFLAVADCTGHGVPGALLSIIGLQRLNESLEQDGAATSDMLRFLNHGIKASLKQTGAEHTMRDGMDIALCSVEYADGSDPEKYAVLSYSGANRPVWVIRKGAEMVEELKATKRAIGGFTEDTQEYELKELQLQKGDSFYLFSDGFADQFGGEKGKKLMTKHFRKLLLDIQGRSMSAQHTYLENFAARWQDGAEQIDDILVIGVQV